MTREYFDIVIYCPLEEEFKEVCEILGYDLDRTDEFEILSLEKNINQLRILIVAGDEMGVQAAQNAAMQIKIKCEFKLYLCLGIAGSISNDIELGDVCYSGTVLDVTANQKITDAGTELTFSPHRTAFNFTRSLNFFRRHPLLKDAHDKWTSLCDEELIIHANANEFVEKNLKKFTSHSGCIITGPVVASEEFKKQLKKLDRKALAVETEVGGVFSHFERNDEIVVMTLRGISDAADSNKNELEGVTKGVVRKIAIRNATHFLRVNLEYNTFFTSLFRNDKTGNLLTEIETKSVSYSDLLSIALDRTSKRLISELKQHSIELKDINENYWVPAPRLLELEEYENQDGRPSELQELIFDRSHFSIEIPFGYPDGGAPCLYALQLLSNEIDGRSLVPVLINSSSFAPPRSIHHFSDDFTASELDQLSQRDDCMLVYIVEELPIGSNTKISHLISELGSHQHSKSISFLSYQSIQQFGKQTVPDFFRKYRIESLSFSGIAKYMRRKYEMEFAESESVALKLSQTFDEYDLPAHPSYFAGIPKDFLFKLLEANRRSELLELAVTGFLTIAVASDESKVRLSRTTRKRFLVDVLKKMEIDGQTMQVTDLHELAEKILKEYDFDVQTADFVSNFFEYGLLRQNGTHVEFPIPFIKSFLLAEFLSKDPAEAKKYFNIHADEFDFSTYVIYCELNGAGPLLADILKCVQKDVEDFYKIIGQDESERSVRHALLDSKISPETLKNKSAVVDAKDRLTKYANNVLECEDEAENKQQILDLHTAADSSLHQREEEAEQKLSYNGKNKLLRDLNLAQLTIGAGAEHIIGESKQSLALEIIKLTSLIADDWYREVDSFDYSSTKELLLEDLIDHFRSQNEECDEEKMKKFVGTFIDIVEMNRFMDVMRSLMGPLKEVASQPVLYKSLVQLKTSDQISELLRAIWLVSIDERKGEKAFNSAIKKLPARAFPRISIACHIINQAYWFSSNEVQKLGLLALSDEALKPIGLTSNPDRK